MKSDGCREMRIQVHRFIRRIGGLVCIATAMCGCVTMPQELKGRVTEAYATNVTSLGPLRLVVVASFLAGHAPPRSIIFQRCSVNGAASVYVLGTDCRPEDTALAAKIAEIPSAMGKQIGGRIDVRGLRVVRVDAQYGGVRQERAAALGSLPTMSFLLRNQADPAAMATAAIEVVAHELSHVVQHQRLWRGDLDGRERSAVWIGRCTALALTGTVIQRAGKDIPETSARTDVDSSLRMSAESDKEWAAFDGPAVFGSGEEIVQVRFDACTRRVREYSTPMLEGFKAGPLIARDLEPRKVAGSR